MQMAEDQELVALIKEEPIIKEEHFVREEPPRMEIDKGSIAAEGHFSTIYLKEEPCINENPSIKEEPVDDMDMDIRNSTPTGSDRKQNSPAFSIHSVSPNKGDEEMQEGMDQESRYETNGRRPRDIHPLFDGKYFKITYKNGNKIMCVCVRCPNKTIAASVTSFSNLYTHLKRLHPGVQEEARQYVTEKRAAVRRKFCSVNCLSRSYTECVKQMTMAKNFTGYCHSNPPKVSQKDVNSALMAFIVQGIHPLTVVEQAAFKNFVYTLNPDIDVMSKRALGCYIREFELDKKALIKKEIQQHKYICLTADIWSTRHCSYINISAHWIDGVKLERGGAALACRRFEAPCTYIIAEILDEISVEFSIPSERVVSIVTQNGNNFVKTYNEFGVKLVPVDMQKNRYEYSDEIFEDCVDVDEDEIMFVAPLEYESFEESTEHNYRMVFSNLVKCASHSLSLVATTDAKVALENENFASLTRAVMRKCSALWNKAGCPKSAEMIQQMIGHNLSIPYPTLWNSFYDSISVLLKHISKLNDLMTSLQLPGFESHELEYLEEYKRTLTPVARAIDHLEGDRSTYYGELIPTLLMVETQLEETQTETLNHCSPLLDAILCGFKARFSKYLSLDPDVNEAVLATVSHPYFKLRWIGLKKNWNVQVKTSIVQEAFMAAAQEFRHINDENARSHSSEDDEYFSFDRNTPESSTSESPEMMVLTYLKDPDTSLKSLHNHPIIRNIFLKFNTTLASSAPVERLFSSAELICLPRRGRMSNKLFESLMLLKANTHISLS